MTANLVATRFVRMMQFGRTSPILCGCEDDSERYVGDYVVKLKGHADRAEQAMLAEFLASRLATYFGILVPEPALVEISPAFSSLVAQHQSSIQGGIRNSVGLNFGSKLLVGTSTWPTDKAIPESMAEAAMNVFAFDALIQNPDRRFDNPNVLVNGNDLYIYDHESAFSFLLALKRSRTPWTLDSEDYLSTHVFFQSLRKSSRDYANLKEFADRLKSLSDKLMDQIAAEIPKIWLEKGWSEIKMHLKELRAHGDEFCAAVIRRLA